MLFSHGHAVVIGVGTYQHMAQHNVPLTADDALEVAAVLQDQRYCAYPPQQIKVLTHEQATRSQIMQALDTLGTQAGPDDTVLVFYSGHGEYGADGFYLTTHDTQLVDGKVARGTGVRDVELLEQLRKLPAKRALLIFNACHSGELSSPSLGASDSHGSEGGRNLPADVAVALLGTGEGRVVITACREQQKSYFVKDAPLTLFAGSLADALRGRGVANRHGYISVFDLYDYVFSSTSKYVQETWGLSQEPMLTINRGVGVMAVALYRAAEPTADATALPASPALGSAVREVDPAESQRRLQQFLNGAINLAAGRDLYVYGDTVHGDSVTTQGAQGLINRPQAPVSQNFGTQHTVTTSNGDYAEGNLDKRSGAFISGGTVYGPVVGTNSGTITTTYAGSGGGSSPSNMLQQAVERTRQEQQLLRQRGNGDLADDLDSVVNALDLARKAQQQGNHPRYAAKVQEARARVHELTANNSSLHVLCALLDRIT